MASRRLAVDDVVDMLSDVDTGDSEDDIGEPMCPGSDIEFPSPDPDSDDERYYYNYYYYRYMGRWVGLSTKMQHRM